MGRHGADSELLSHLQGLDLRRPQQNTACRWGRHLQHLTKKQRDKKNSYRLKKVTAKDRYLRRELRDTFFLSAYTVYPVTRTPLEVPAASIVTGSQLIRAIPGEGPCSSCTSSGASGGPAKITGVRKSSCDRKDVM